ncbi:unnamed protein product [Staurois parvus]|uniref:Uncharacterized protein n=1 Tax=Staurois parvus TaxID=386267 RepID=A0ABN9FJ13_9NEOB|nr:unnamed protein product [Staurois parvus]
MCHFEISSHSCGCPFCHRLLADYRPSIGATKPQIGHGPPYRLVTLLLVPQCDLGPCTASPLLPLCHVPLSGLLTLLLVSILS